MTRSSEGKLRGPIARRFALLAVLAPLTVVSTSGLLRPQPDERQGVLAAPAAAAVESSPGPHVLPDPVQAPASVTRESGTGEPGLGVLLDRTAASAGSIPARALVAYQRAEAVIAQADPSCHLSWALIAAIGKVESNHGRFGGALMTADGVVHPAIYGPRLTGRDHTSRIGDTDAGLLDGDQKYDRAVGPMQFIPSTWTVVGVDADGDGRRDPQDIDDASLATAVYLCSGDDDLSGLAGQRSAVHRYNHSAPYVALVLRIMTGYLHADPAQLGVLGGPGFVFPPTGTGGPGAEPTPGTPQPTFDVVPSTSPTATAQPTDGPTVTPTGKPTPTTTATSTPTPSVTPTDAATPTATASALPSQLPTQLPSDAGSTTPTDESTATPPGEPSTSATATPTAGPTDTPSDTPTDSPSDPPGDPAGDPGSGGSVEIPQALLDAWATCLETGIDAGDLPTMTTCLTDSTGLPADDPALVALLANPPVTPPTGTPKTQPRRRRRTR